MSRKSRSKKRKRRSGRRRRSGGALRELVHDLGQLQYPPAFRIPASAELPGGEESDAAAPATPAAAPTTRVLSVETKDLLLLIASVATGLWRVRRRMAPEEGEELSSRMQKAWRHVQSTWDALTAGKVIVRDHTGEPYVTGMALKVIAFEPTAGVQCETIVETIKPSIFYDDNLIQRGEVIVATPEEPAEETPAEQAAECPGGDDTEVPPDTEPGELDEDIAEGDA